MKDKKSGMKHSKSERVHHHMKKAAEHHNMSADMHEKAKSLLMKGEAKGRNKKMSKSSKKKEK